MLAGSFSAPRIPRRCYRLCDYTQPSFCRPLVLPRCSPPRSGRQELPADQSEADYRERLDGNPGHRGQVLSFEAWQEAAGVGHVLASWQLIRTASMWRECGGPPFEVPPFRLWPGMVRTLRFIRARVKGAVGEVEAGSGYAIRAKPVRPPVEAAPLDFFARSGAGHARPAPMFERLCPCTPASGRRRGVGFYAFQRSHRHLNFRRWGRPPGP